MTPEEKKLLESTHELAVQNNKILLSMRRSARVGTIVKILYWVVIIILSFGAIYFIQPYIDMLKGVTGGGVATPGSYAAQMQDLLK